MGNRSVRMRWTQTRTYGARDSDLLVICKVQRNFHTLVIPSGEFLRSIAICIKNQKLKHFYIKFLQTSHLIPASVRVPDLPPNLEFELDPRNASGEGPTKGSHGRIIATIKLDPEAGRTLVVPIHRIMLRTLAFRPGVAASVSRFTNVYVTVKGKNQQYAVIHNAISRVRLQNVTDCI